MKYRAITCILTIALVAAASPATAISFKEALRTADPAAKYLFYIHGAIIETQGKHAVSERYGTYEYDEIIKHFDERGLTVIDEVRGATQPTDYAAKTVTRIRKLVAAGVPPGNICVAGFSKGGFITMLVASSLGLADVAYVNMAGCGRGRAATAYESFVKRKRGARLKGRMFSIYAGSDLEAGSCKDAADQAPKDGFTFRELRLRSDKGHGIFYQPRPEWIEPSASWARGGQ